MAIPVRDQPENCTHMRVMMTICGLALTEAISPKVMTLAIIHAMIGFH